MKKVIFLLVLVFASTMIFVGCAADPTPTPAAAPADAAAPAPADAAAPAPADAAAPAPAPAPADADPDRVFRIGVSLPPILNDFHAAMRVSIEEAIANAPPNFEFYVVSAMSESDQFDVLETFYLMNFDGVVISPLNGTLIAPIAEDIYFSGTPTVIINRAIDSEHFRTFVACDNVQGARTAANHIAEFLGGEGTIFIARMAAGTPIDSERTYPFIEVIENYWPGITIIGYAEAGNTRDGGFDVMNNAMAAHPVINAVWCGSEIAALGVAHAVELAGRTDVQIVMGFGASQALVDELDANPDFIVQSMCYVAAMGENAIIAMMDILLGRDVGRFQMRESIVLNHDNLDYWRQWAH